MQQFRIKENGFEEIRKRALIRSISFMGIAVIGCILVGLDQASGTTDDINILFLLIPLFVILLGISVYSSLNRLKKVFESYKLTLTDNEIICEQLKLPTVSISHAEIENIIQRKNGNLVIRSKHPHSNFWIPKQLEDYETLKTALNKIHPITPQTSINLFQDYPQLSSLLTTGLLLCVFIASNKILVALSGTLMSVYLVWGFFSIRQSKQLNARTKRISWVMLVVLASVIGTMIFKLLAMPK